MDDPRLEWIQHQIYTGLNLNDPEIFNEFLARDDNENEQLLLKFISDTPQGDFSSLLFYHEVKEEEEEVEVEDEPEIPDVEAELENTEGGENVTAVGNETLNTTLQTTAPSPSTASKDVKEEKSSARDEETEEGRIEEDDEEEAEPVKKTKIIIQKVWRTYLHVSHEYIPKSADHVNSYIYFVRTTEGMVPLPANLEEAEMEMPKHFEFGLQNVDTLVILTNIIHEAFMPLLRFTQHKHGEESGVLSEPFGSKYSVRQKEMMEEDERKKLELSPQEWKARAQLRDEFFISMEKFAQTITRTQQQLEGQVRLEIPDIELSDNIQENLKNKDLLEQVRDTVMQWQRLIEDALQELMKRKPLKNGPLAEIDYWRERNSALSGLIEQLKQPIVEQFYEIFRQAEGIIDNQTINSLNKAYAEAKDNVRFLSTLERHFKNITHGSSFSSVSETLPGTMNALRMVWIISRHYNTEERMIGLMERIAWQLCDRVAMVINVRTIFQYDSRSNL